MRNRIFQHINNSKNKKNPNTVNQFYQDILNVGIYNFEFGILKESEIESLEKIEYQFIKYYYDTNPNNLYNKFIKNSKDNVVRSNLLLDSELTSSLINDLRNTKVSYKELSKKYGYSENTLYDFNAGYYYRLEGLEYPIRKYKATKQYITHTLICKYCNKEFKHTNKKTKYCSDYCINNSKLKNSIIVGNDFIIRNGVKINRNELYNKLLASNFEKVSKYYGVSSNALRKWCDLLGISRYSKDYM